MILIICGAKCILELRGTLDIYCNDLMSLFIVPLFFLLFHELQHWMKDRNSKVKSFVKRSVQLIGVNTLQIYVLQYFSFRLFDYLSNNTLTQFRQRMADEPRDSIGTLLFMCACDNCNK